MRRNQSELSAISAAQDEGGSSRSRCPQTGTTCALSPARRRLRSSRQIGQLSSSRSSTITELMKDELYESVVAKSRGGDGGGVVGKTRGVGKRRARRSPTPESQEAAEAVEEALEPSYLSRSLWQLFRAARWTPFAIGMRPSVEDAGEEPERVGAALAAAVACGVAGVNVQLAAGLAAADSVSMRRRTPEAMVRVLRASAPAPRPSRPVGASAVRAAVRPSAFDHGGRINAARAPDAR